ncbi:hypothetical protein BDR07DRAFT_1375213 [Suillus spraguei]|nr:hypothetical protein BDR07DRAFT_1375213 [Suillus spraguei]
MPLSITSVRRLMDPCMPMTAAAGVILAALAALVIRQLSSRNQPMLAEMVVAVLQIVEKVGQVRVPDGGVIDSSGGALIPDMIGVPDSRGIDSSEGALAPDMIMSPLMELLDPGA